MGGAGNADLPTVLPVYAGMVGLHRRGRTARRPELEPNYAAIARVRPDVILTSGEDDPTLARIAPTVYLANDDHGTGRA